MSSAQLIRWSGVAALVFGVLNVLIAVVHFVFFPIDLARSSVYALSTWQILQAVDLTLKILFLWALVGLYSRQAKEAGILGLAGFLALFAGYMLSFGTQWGFFMLGPDLTRAAPAVLDADIPSGVLGFVAEFFPYALSFLGLVLFALATLLAKVYPRSVAVLLLLTLVVGGAVLFVSVGVGFLVGDVLFGAGIAWMGYTLWAERREPTGQRAVAAVP